MRKVIQKIGIFLKMLVGKEFEFLKKNSALAVEVTNNLKAVVESSIVQGIIALTPSKADDEILYRVRKCIEKVAIQVAVAHEIIRLSETNGDVVEKIVLHLKTMNQDKRVGFWLEFSGRLNQTLADGRITLAEAVAMAQMVYVENKRAA